VTDREQLNRLVVEGARLRSTPIVDDDFPAIRDGFDSELRRAGEHLKRQRPVIVCLCGSTRFWRTFQEASLRETLAGKIVLSIGAARCADADDKTFGGYVPADEYDRVKVALDELHCRKIDMADEVLVLNVEGYVGDSTRREIQHAIKTRRPIRWWEPNAVPPEFMLADIRALVA
jgi:hypothetical protein